MAYPDRGYGPPPRRDDPWADRRDYDPGYPPRMYPGDRHGGYRPDTPPHLARPDDDYYRGRGGPPPERRGSKRVRSPSPRGMGDYNPRGQKESPDTLVFKVTRRYFRDWLESIKPDIAANDDKFESAWQQYLIEFKRRELERFFGTAKNDPWFREKYDASKPMSDLRARLKAKGRGGRLLAFLDDFEAARLEEVTFDYPETAPAENGKETNGESAGDGDDKPKDPNAATLETTSDPDETAIPGSDTKVYIRNIEPTVAREDIEKICSKAESFQYLALSEPAPTRSFMRVGWAVFGDATDASSTTSALNESRLGVDARPIPHPAVLRTKAAPSLVNTPERIEVDLDNVRRAVLALEKEEGDSRGSAAIEDKFEKAKAEIAAEADTPEDEQNAKKTALNRKTLDLYLHYLRTVFHSCFYCLSTFNFPEELARKCPKHLRREAKPNAIRAKPEEVAWLEWFDERVPLFSSRAEVNPLDYGGEDEDAALRAMCEAHFIEEEAGKFRCGECNKLFSAQKFIIKHLTTKHGDKIDESKLEDIKFFNNYALDPVRLPAPTIFDNFTPSSVRDRLAEASSAANRPLVDRLGPAGGDDSVSGSGRKRRRPTGLGRDDPMLPPMSGRGPPPPPPAGAKLDPRALRGLSAYDDLDNAPAGAADDVVLQY